MLIYNYRLQVNFAPPPSLALASCNIVRLCRERFCKAGSSLCQPSLSSLSSFTSSLLPKVSFRGEIKRGIIAHGGRWSGFAPLLPTLAWVCYRRLCSKCRQCLLPAEACRAGVGWPGLEGPRLMNPPELLLAPTSFPPVPPPSEGGMGGVRNDVQTSHITTDSPLSPLSSHPSATKVLNLIPAKSLEPFHSTSTAPC